jgi:DNA-binding SARP family transcriptional activator
METFWPDSPGHAARSSLTSALWSLRRELSSLGAPIREVLESDRHTVRLAPNTVITDVEEFEASLARARVAVDDARIAALRRAADLYAGELLRGQHDDWIFPEQRRLAAAYDRCVTDLCSLLAVAGEAEAALHYAAAGARADPWSESACLRLMRHYAAAGQPRVAVEHFHDFSRRLRTELDARPGSEIQEFTSHLAATADPWIPNAPPGAKCTSPPEDFEPIGGVTPLGSPFYLKRRPDLEMTRALERRESLLLLKGPRQTGKTSLLARGLLEARESGYRVVFMDLQAFSDEQLETLDQTLFALAEGLSLQLDLDVRPRSVWDADRGPMLSLRHYLRRHVLGAFDEPLLWALDGLDRLFPRPFGSRVFALFRAWYNERSLDPESEWGRLTLALAYASEAHLFISDLNQSPFNVGRRLELSDFDLEETAELNRRYGSPLRSPADLRRLRALLGGHPCLIRQALAALRRTSGGLDELEHSAPHEHGPFGEHLQRLRSDIGRDPEIRSAIELILGTGRCPSAASFYRLRSAGLILGEEPERVRFRCDLYPRYFDRCLHARGLAEG